MNIINTGKWLDQQEFEPPEWVVPGLIPQGTCILAGHPKIGKSFLVLAIALAAAQGGQVLGVNVDQRPVLYLALEDSEPRIQKRARHLVDTLPEEFYFISRTHREQALKAAQQWVKEHADRQPLVIVDTLETIRPQRGANAYSDDYRAGALLQTMEADGGAVIAVHHSRKGASDDFLEEVSGTLGLVGSVDTTITLKRTRNDIGATLSVTGRDVDETAYSVTFLDGKWHAADGLLAAAADKASEPQMSAKMTALLEFVNTRERTTAADIANQFPDIKEATIRTYLTRLAKRGLIRRAAQGLYQPVAASQLSHDILEDLPRTEAQATSAP